MAHDFGQAIKGNRMLKLYQFTPRQNLPNLSPFCLKLETYLKMANIPYQVQHVNDPRKSPKGKLPHIQDGNIKLGDSELIMQYCQKRYQVTLDNHLSPWQQANKVAITRLCDDHLYWIILYSRWLDEQFWPEFKSLLFRNANILEATVVASILHHTIKKQCYAQGISRHARHEIYDLGIQDLNALELLLNEQDYFFNNQVSSLDATVFGFTLNIIRSPLKTPLADHMQSLPGLNRHCENILKHYYPDYLDLMDK